MTISVTANKGDNVFNIAIKYSYGRSKGSICPLSYSRWAVALTARNKPFILAHREVTFT